MLKLKANYLFALLFIPFVLVGIIVPLENTPTTDFLMHSLAMVDYVIFLIWLYSIAKMLLKKKAISRRKYILLNVIFLAIPTIIGLLFIMLNVNNVHLGFLSLLIINSIMLLLLYIIATLSIGLKKYELGRTPVFEEWLINAFFLFFFPLGVWIIQPVLNEMVLEEESD